MSGSAYASAVLTDTPGLYWKQQEASGLPQDSSGNARHATSVAGTPGYQQGGQANMGDFAMRYVSGTNNAVRNPHGLGTMSGDVAIEGWFYFESIAAGTQIVRWGSAGANGMTLNLRATGQFYVGVNAVSLSDSAASLSANTWYHIVVVRESTVWKYYLNGSLDTASAGTTSPTAPSSNNISIGSPFTLRSEHFAVYPTTALTSTRVSAHYTAALVPGDRTGYAIAGLVAVGSTVSLFVKAGRGVAGLAAAGVSQSTPTKVGRGIVGGVGAGVSQKIAAGGGVITNKTGFGEVHPFSFGSKIVTHVGATTTKAGRGIVGTTAISTSGQTTQPRGVSLAIGQTVLTEFPVWTRIDDGA